MSKVKLTLKFDDPNDAQFILSLYHALTCADDEWWHSSLDMLPKSLGYLHDRVKENLRVDDFSWSKQDLFILKKMFDIPNTETEND